MYASTANTGSMAVTGYVKPANEKDRMPHRELRHMAMRRKPLNNPKRKMPNDCDASTVTMPQNIITQTHGNAQETAEQSEKENAKRL